MPLSELLIKKVGGYCAEQKNFCACRRKEPQMDTDTHGLLLENKTRQIIGGAIEALNALRCGLLEKPQENALVVQRSMFYVRGAQTIRSVGP